MKHPIILTIGFLSFLISPGQSACDTKNISGQNKAMLLRFCDQFKVAVNSKDKHKLKQLISFPFTCSHCVIDTAKENFKPYINVTEKLFEKSQYQIFFTTYLIETINRNNLLDILFVEETEKKPGCSYSFSYPIVKPSSGWEGLQGFFSVRKVKGQYKITSAWTVP